MSQKDYYVYILTDKKGGNLYIGITSNLEGRIWEHKNKTHKGFTSKYDINKIVYYENYSNINEAIAREKQLKKWNRQWKIDLIEGNNPEWEDLYHSL